MFIVDDILLSPMRGFMWIVRELHKAAQNEIQNEADQLTHRLSTLYMMLETAAITQDEFDAQEKDILARLDEIRSGDDSDENDDSDDSDDSDENDDSDDSEQDENDDQADEDQNEDNGEPTLSDDAGGTREDTQ